MRVPLILILAGALGACSTQVPDSGYDEMSGQAPGAASAANGLFIPPSAVSGEALPPAPAGVASAASVVPTGPAPATAQTTDSFLANASSDADLAAETAAALAASSSNSGVAPVVASPSNPAPEIQVPAPVVEAPAPAVENSAGLSTENDFKSVANARTIESDAERIARNRQQYQLIQPTALPTRDGSAGPNIVTFALETTHERGTQMYNRSGLRLPGHTERACARYPSPDQAQIDFLASGGPERDRRGLDPDGDGFACDWNPAPFRTATKH